ncbi:hypothetical protein C8F04DRAFT_1134201 [Mycena alexandri]|uniref:Uncharacterized protein n=1 Tax=Mycena alexandri TaxID=1745969 RepID=A0AAD6S956_9AGAR|nr:hypothetical protein C8F04DRAFT_1134201 [Mycena alexandri]
MGNVTARQLELHRILGLAICHSTTIDPRRMEHYNYTYWTADVAALIVRGHLKHCLLAPQFPIYISPKEPFLADTSIGSARTMADGDAEGVYVDIAIVMPVVQPRYVQQLGALSEELENKSLHSFFEDLLPEQLEELSPRCLWVSGLEAPVIVELKRGATRHAEKIDAFYHDLNLLLGRGMLQAEAQGLCLFSSWRFATQRRVVLLAGAGEYYTIRLVTRDWAADELGDDPYSAEGLKVVKGLRGDDYDDDDDDDSDNADDDDDDDWTEGRVDEMYGSPLNALERQKKLNAERDIRAAKRAAQREQYFAALATPPAADRTVPLFADEALDAVHPGGDLFESRPPEHYFAPGGTEAWSGVLRLGSERSNAYMAKIQDFIREQEIREDDRRKGVFFRRATV